MNVPIALVGGSLHGQTIEAAQRLASPGEVLGDEGEAYMVMKVEYDPEGHPLRAEAEEVDQVMDRRVICRHGIERGDCDVCRRSR